MHLFPRDSFLSSLFWVSMEGRPTCACARERLVKFSEGQRFSFRGPAAHVASRAGLELPQASQIIACVYTYSM